MKTIGTLLGATVIALLTTPLMRGQSTGGPGTSPDGLWQIVENVEFPPRYSPPSAFVALRLNEPGLQAILAGAGRETFGRIPRSTVFSLPLPDKTFASVAAQTSEVMEPALASRFPQLRAFVFETANGEMSGKLAASPFGVHFVAQTAAGMLRVEPVQAVGGTIYVCYLNRNRTDGTDVIEHPDDEHEGDNEPGHPAGPMTMDAPTRLAAPLQLANVTSGQQLRIYRMAAATTGEFYQGRDTGNGLLDVLFSLIIDLNGANAIFEPEVGVRLILSLTTLQLMYDDPDTDPFDNSATACTLRNANRDNLIANAATISDADYDLSFLFASKAGGGANGCAWYVVCLTTSNTLHKGRGAGKMGNNGANSASGLLAHEVGHMLGARHTFTGQDGSCTLNEFLAGDSESGYEPGSGTTRMSYRGNCDSDDVDTSAVGAGSYFHSRSFDEIVTNVLTGDGATCGTLVNTTNMPPTVDAGADYTIPRQTPFTLSGSGADDEPLTFNWEQYDRAITQRPINTDPGDGPIVRSMPPGADASRTIPFLQDLLDGVVRNGEILPQVDRELNFRLIARDNLMGAGGVAYDAMTINVEGSPFFITSPNSGSLQAACAIPLTWQVGGGSVAPNVSVLFSDDGGQTFATTIAASTPNDGAYSMPVPCQLGSESRIKLQSVGNIFFDISDNDLTVVNDPPVVNVTAAGGAVNNACEFTLQFNATASDSCGLLAGDVTVDLLKADNNFTLGTPTVNVQQVSNTQVSVSGSVLVSNLSSSPAEVTVRVTAVDACGASTNDVANVDIVDDTAPTIAVSLNPSVLWPANHLMEPIQATVVANDNCAGVSFALTSVVSNEPDNGAGDGDTINDIDGTAIGTADLSFLLRRERVGSGSGRIYTVTYTATDGSNNATQGAAIVTVPKSQKP